MYLLSYSPRESKIYLCDRDVNIYAWSLSLTVIEYQTAILRGDLDTAAEVLPTIPSDQRNRIARFLESQDLKELAMNVTEDVEHRFDLAIQLDKLDIAVDIARKVDTEVKWKTVGDFAMVAWKLGLAEECLERANDLSGLLLLHTSGGNATGIRKVADLARKFQHNPSRDSSMRSDVLLNKKKFSFLFPRKVAKGKNNIAFSALLQLGATQEAIDLLIKTDRIPEAAMFARTYMPSETSRVVKLWKQELEKNNRPKVAESLADPENYPNLFPELHAVNGQPPVEEEEEEEAPEVVDDFEDTVEQVNEEPAQEDDVALEDEEGPVE